jgi:hypothetical protein
MLYKGWIYYYAVIINLSGNLSDALFRVSSLPLIKAWLVGNDLS